MPFYPSTHLMTKRTLFLMVAVTWPATAAPVVLDHKDHATLTAVGSNANICRQSFHFGVAGGTSGNPTSNDSVASHSPLTVLVSLEAISFVESPNDSNAATAGDLYLKVFTDAEAAAAPVAVSSNAINVRGAINGGAQGDLTWTFPKVSLASAKTYHVRWSTNSQPDNTGLSIARIAAAHFGGGFVNTYKGGTASTTEALHEADFDARFEVTFSLVPESGIEKQPPALEPQFQPLDPSVFQTTICKSGDHGVHTYRIPGLATTKAGTLIAVFDARNKGGGDLPGDMDVGMMRSTDNGKTWSSLQRIMDYDAAVPGSRGNGVGDPAVLVDQRTGSILVAALWSMGPHGWNGSGPGLRPEETGQFVISRSEDDGLTWTKPVSITPQIKDPAWRLCFQGPGNGIQLKDGTLVFPAQFKDAGKRAHSCFIASKDGGKTWQISPPAAPNTSESAIAELSGQGMLLSMRNEAKTGQRLWAKWEWSGPDVMQGKWGEPFSTLPDPTCMASLIRHPNGSLLFCNPAHSKKRMSLTVRQSKDDGKTWSTGSLLEPAGAMYSSLTVLKDGSAGVLYESGPASGLVFASFPMKWLEETDATKRE